PSCGVGAAAAAAAILPSTPMTAAPFVVFAVQPLHDGPLACVLPRTSDAVVAVAVCGAIVHAIMDGGGGSGGFAWEGTSDLQMPTFWRFKTGWLSPEPSISCSVSRGTVVPQPPEIRPCNTLSAFSSINPLASLHAESSAGPSTAAKWLTHMIRRGRRALLDTSAWTGSHRGVPGIVLTSTKGVISLVNINWLILENQVTLFRKPPHLASPHQKICEGLTPFFNTSSQSSFSLYQTRATPALLFTSPDPDKPPTDLPSLRHQRHSTACQHNQPPPHCSMVLISA
ncbi:hypothetical protein Vafri_7950, partial [Volvox africanus]